MLIIQEYESEYAIAEGEIEYIDYTDKYIFRGVLKITDAWNNDKVFRSKNIVVGCCSIEGITARLATHLADYKMGVKA